MPTLTKLLGNQLVNKKELLDVRWHLANPDYDFKPVDIKEFINSPDYLNAGSECWDSVKADLIELFNGKYNEAVFCCSTGSGKSYGASIIIAYMVYKTLCLHNPQTYFGMAKHTHICFLNMSVRAEQSKKVVFGEIKARIDNSRWFQKYYPPDPTIKSELRFAKHIFVFPGNSRETFPLGFNITSGFENVSPLTKIGSSYYSRFTCIGKQHSTIFIFYTFSFIHHLWSSRRRSNIL